LEIQLRHDADVPNWFAIYSRRLHRDLSLNVPKSSKGNQLLSSLETGIAENDSRERGHGPQPALAVIDALVPDGDLDGYHLMHATRAELLRRIGSSQAAAEAYTKALALVTNNSERRFLERRLDEVRSQTH
jgi:hypothetical protein